MPEAQPEISQIRSVWKTPTDRFRPEGTVEKRLCIPLSFQDKSLIRREPDTLCLVNFRCRFATSDEDAANFEDEDEDEDDWRENIKSPPDLSVEQGQMGTGRSSRSLSRAGIRRSPFRGLPDSRRHSPGQAEFRPRGRAVQRLSIAEFQVRLFSSLQLVVAATSLRTGSRHACDFSFAS